LSLKRAYFFLNQILHIWKWEYVMDNVTISIQKSIIKREFDLSIPRNKKGKDVKKGKKE